MPNPRRNRRPRLRVEAIEPRDLPAGLDLAGLAALGSSPLVSAARTAMLAYNVGQLAYTGHTSLLFGAVQVSQPFALKDLGTGSQPRVAPTPIRSRPPASPTVLAGTREGGPDRLGNSAIPKLRHDRGLHLGWYHSANKHKDGRGHGGNHGG